MKEALNKINQKLMYKFKRKVTTHLSVYYINEKGKIC